MSEYSMRFLGRDPDVVVSECLICHALVDIDSERLHTQWHESLKPRLP